MAVVGQYTRKGIVGVRFEPRGGMAQFGAPASLAGQGLAVTGTTDRFQIPVFNGGDPYASVGLTNTGGIVFIALGDSTIEAGTADDAYDMVLLDGNSVAIGTRDATHIAAISTGTSTLYMWPWT